MTIETTAFDAALYLGSDEAVAEFMADALESGDAGYIAHALGVVARAKGMTQLAADTGLSRESLYKALSPNGNPTLTTLLSVMKAMNLRLDARPITHQA
ncbi:addiction module antidote protein [Falsigemmobacter intermedius]|uniref:addiction module antidote protein n=1 Tax=Falsigemmobacter intermedius TaxID=1553448 RepID=UPI003F0B0833